MKKYIVMMVLLVAAFSAGRFSSPAKVETKEVEKSVQQTDESVNRNQNVTEVTKETRLPDGTVIKETRKEKETSTQKESESLTDKEKSSSKVVENRPDWRVGGIYEPGFSSFQSDSYTLMLERRMFSELYLGVSYSSRNTVGIAISLGF